jgi:hypothetical protein
LRDRPFLIAVFTMVDDLIGDIAKYSAAITTGAGDIQRALSAMKHSVVRAELLLVQHGGVREHFQLIAPLAWMYAAPLGGAGRRFPAHDQMRAYGRRCRFRPAWRRSEGKLGSSKFDKHMYCGSRGWSFCQPAPIGSPTTDPEVRGLVVVLLDRAERRFGVEGERLDDAGELALAVGGEGADRSHVAISCLLEPRLPRPRWLGVGRGAIDPAPLAAATQWRFGDGRFFCFAMQSATRRKKAERLCELRLSSPVFEVAVVRSQVRQAAFRRQLHQRPCAMFVLRSKMPATSAEGAWDSRRGTGRR